jgi:hypothetical protein
MNKHTNTFNIEPIVGELISGYSDGPWYHSTWSGIYDGARVSEWDGELKHFIIDGEINNIEQGCFALPVYQFANNQQRGTK